MTSAGAEYLSDPTASRLYALAESNVAGFAELLAALREGPRTPAELLAYLNEVLGTAWETEAQIRFRLGWLETLGLAGLAKGSWRRVAGYVRYFHMLQSDHDIVAVSMLEGSSHPAAACPTLVCYSLAIPFFIAGY